MKFQWKLFWSLLIAAFRSCCEKASRNGVDGETLCEQVTYVPSFEAQMTWTDWRYDRCTVTRAAGGCSEGEDELLLHSTATGVTTGRFQSYCTRLWSQSLGGPLLWAASETTQCSSSWCPCVSDLCAKSLRPVTAQWAGQPTYNSWLQVGQFGSINNATGSFTGFSQFLQASAGMVPQLGHDFFPSTFFQIHYSLTLPSLDTVWSQTLLPSVNNRQINK